MKKPPTPLKIALIVLIGACASTSLALSRQHGEPQRSISQALEIRLTKPSSEWLRVSEESPQGFYLSVPSQRWVF